MTQYVAIGTDGMRPVVWGLGESPEAALIEAREQVMLQSEDDCDFGGMLTLPVTEEQATLVEGGEVSTEALGIMLPASWLRGQGL